MTHAGRTYDRIATHFARTRAYAWPEVESFVADAERRLRRPAVGLDLGCGNGRHAETLAAVVDRVVGVDASGELLVEAGDRAAAHGFELDPVVGDAATVPLAADAVDLAVYVATVHHLRPRRRRVASLDELARVLAPTGRGLLSAWSVVHDRFDAEDGFDTEIDWTLPDGETVPRFYHVYDPTEFEADLAASSLSVVESFVSSGNCYAVVEPETG